MTISEKWVNEFLHVLGGVMASYGQVVEEFEQELWLDAFSDVDINTFSSALRSHLHNPDSGMFRPTIAHIKRILNGTTSNKSAIAVGKFMAAIRQAGAWRNVVFDDPFIGGAISDMGGWPAICKRKESELSITQNQFIKLYEGHIAISRVEDMPKIVCGLQSNDEDFLSVGMKPIPPVFIGDPVVCENLLLQHEATSHVRALYHEDGTPRASFVAMLEGIKKIPEK